MFYDKQSTKAMYVSTSKDQRVIWTRHACSASSALTGTSTVNPAGVAAEPHLSARGKCVVSEFLYRSTFTEHIFRTLAEKYNITLTCRTVESIIHLKRGYQLLDFVYFHLKLRSYD